MPPRNAKLNAQGVRTYRWEDRELLSVTSIRHLVGESHGLVNWKLAKIVERAMSEEYAQKRTSLGDRELKQWLRNGAEEDRMTAADRGTSVHEAIEHGLSVQQAAEDVKPYLLQYNAMLEDTGMKLLAHEYQCWHLTAGYAGTADAFAELNGDIVVVDWKTSKNIYLDYVVQLHAYLGAEFVGADNKVDEHLTGLLHRAKKGVIVHLSPTGWSIHVVPFTPTIFRAFLGTLAFAQLNAEHATPDNLWELERRGRARA